MYHHRRKSGHSHNNTSTTDARKSTSSTESSSKPKRPTAVRRHTPSSAQKSSRSHRDLDRDREQERDHYDSWQDERESFPQFCTTCEKQFMTLDEKHLYCSETCRTVDQNSTSHMPQMSSYSVGSHHSYLSTGYAEPRDIIPRASPSRPISTHSYQSSSTSPVMVSTSQYSSALSALRSLSIAPASPPSPAGSNSGSLWPFSRSAATSPSEPARRPSGPYLSSTYDTGYYHNPAAYTYDTGANELERPLPSRHPGVYSRPKSIELVTPLPRR